MCSGQWLKAILCGQLLTFPPLPVPKTPQTPLHHLHVCDFMPCSRDVLVFLHMPAALSYIHTSARPQINLTDQSASTRTAHKVHGDRGQQWSDDAPPTHQQSLCYVTDATLCNVTTSVALMLMTTASRVSVRKNNTRLRHRLSLCVLEGNTC